MVLSYLRRDSRENLTKISKHTGIPVSTLFDQIKKYKGNVVRKHTTLLNFGKMGYDVHIHLMLKSKISSKEALEHYLMGNMFVNSCYKVNNGFDFMVELIFKNMSDYNNFNEKLDLYSVVKKNEFFVLKELKRESFLDNIDMVSML